MPDPGATTVLAVRFNVAITVIVTLLCVAGVVFMIRFLIALFKDGGTKSRCHVVYLTSRHQEMEDSSCRLAAAEGVAFESGDVGSRPGLKVIAGRGERRFRRVG